MDEQEILNLFDNYWFYNIIFSNQPPSPPLPHPIQSKPKPQMEKLAISTVRSSSSHRRSSSDESTFKTDPFSPNSVLPQPKLDTILSGKETEGINLRQETGKKYRKPSRKSVLGRPKKSTKSLSELEFEELKGILDLGFIFDEGKMDSRLVSIVPALQRSGKNEGEENEPVDRKTVSRPYLSEAWDVRRDQERNLLLNWKITAVGDGIDMKDQLRWWAHAVASTVR